MHTRTRGRRERLSERKVDESIQQAVESLSALRDIHESACRGGEGTTPVTTTCVKKTVEGKQKFEQIGQKMIPGLGERENAPVILHTHRLHFPFPPTLLISI